MISGLKGKDFLTLIQSGIKPIIQVHEPFEEFETILDENMKGRVVNAEERDDMVKIYIDLSEFETENDSVMKRNFYDSDGIPCLNAKQAKMYPESNIEEVYLEHNHDLDGWLTINAEYEQEHITTLKNSMLVIEFDRGPGFFDYECRAQNGSNPLLIFKSRFWCSVWEAPRYYVIDECDFLAGDYTENLYPLTIKTVLGEPTDSSKALLYVDQRAGTATLCPSHKSSDDVVQELLEFVPQVIERPERWPVTQGSLSYVDGSKDGTSNYTVEIFWKEDRYAWRYVTVE